MASDAQSSLGQTATASTLANTTATTTSNAQGVAATATSNVQEATAVAAWEASATAAVHATATAATQANVPDPYGLNGRFIFYDPLTGESGASAGGISWQWDLNSRDPEQTTCNFSKQVGLDVKDAGCILSLNRTFKNFVLQVKFTILRGESADINYMRYHLVFLPNGSYRFGDSTTILTSGWSGAFHTGYNQTNIVGLVKQGNTTTWYVNGVQTGSVTVSQEPMGFIELWGFGFSVTTEVSYRDLRIWEV